MDQEFLPMLDDAVRWRIGICSSGGASVGTALVIRKSHRDLCLIELEVPAPVPDGSPDDLFVLTYGGEPMKELFSELAPIWLPLGQLSERAYKRHFPNGLPLSAL